MPQLLVQPDADALHAEAARRIADAAARAQAARGVFQWVLSGGSTPHATYVRLRDAPVDWQRVHVFWGDERAVPATSPDSNQRAAREALLDHVPIPPENVHPIDADASDPERAARSYEAVLRRHLGTPACADLVLLGLGADAHTASLFPDSPVLDASDRLVCPAAAPTLAPRLTWTVPALRAAREILVLVLGAEKRVALQIALAHRDDPGGAPIQRVLFGHPHATILADRRAAHA